MKKIIIGLFFLVSYSGLSQNLRYGAVVGANFYDIEIDGPLIAGTAGSPFNIGGFVDYKLDKSFGIKVHLIYNTTFEGEYNTTPGLITVFESAELKTLQLHALAKYDVRGDYNKGFYFVGGFRMTNVLDAESNENEDLSDFYNKVNFGGQLGFGTTFLKNFSFELVGDYSLSNTLAVDNNKSKNFGCYGNLLFNIEPLFN
ncbi:MAG TPA: outer membrane beta-barrel protein [Flavobacterium sp.]|uniref:outer membrane beta-barrel protein n=1 Tax=Flavobacterium sp. TaxID=239 RepID=UPI002DBA9333|nr:outer membrane beta-barrel protein [Flavobacterium sp.]HEU4790810.1 outer membrane beta-barrel protein [Flavobacterium sp.]